MVAGKPTQTQLTLNVGPIQMIAPLRPRQNGRHLSDDILKCIFLNEKIWIVIKISLKFIHRGPIDNIPALVHIMAWRRPGDKPLSEPMMVSLLTHICVTWPQWVKYWHYSGVPISRTYQNKWTLDKICRKTNSRTPIYTIFIATNKRTSHHFFLAA